MLRGVIRRVFLTSLAVIFVALLFVPFIPLAHAQNDEGFSLQVSPSPLVATIQPSTDTTLELQIRNTNSSTQALKMGLRSFSIDDATGQVQLGEEVTAEVEQMITFRKPTFTLQAGEIFTQQIVVHADKNKGFSYNFAITVSQENPPKGTKGQSAIAGSVAIFTLITVNKTGAVRKFELSSLSASAHSYEYLPAKIDVKLRNSGNINVQPTGTVFIQRHSTDTMPLATLPLNDSGGYILPGATRTFTVAWTDGFPHYKTTQNGTTPKKELNWQGGGMSKLRFGKYVAKVVAIYDDGERDVPIMAEVSFWVIPWRIILITVVVGLIVLVGVFVTVRSIGRAARRASHKLKKAPNHHEDES